MAKILQFVLEYLRLLLGGKNTVKFSIKKYLTIIPSASHLVWTLIVLKRGHFSDLSISSYLLLREAGAWVACGILRLRKRSVQPCPSLKSRKPKNELPPEMASFQQSTRSDSKLYTVEVKWGIFQWQLVSIFTSSRRSLIFPYKLLYFRHDARWSSRSWSVGSLWLPLWLSSFKLHRKTAEAFCRLFTMLEQDQNPEFPHALHCCKFASTTFGKYCSWW